LCRVEASESLLDVTNVDSCTLGVLSTVAIILDVSLDAE
jgi:hypothetical protein